jgi:internalin A
MLKKLLGKNYFLVPLAAGVTLTLVLAVSRLPSSASQPSQSANFSSFAEWCLNKDSFPEGTSSSPRYTIELMLEWLDTKDCLQAAKFLSSSTELNIIGGLISNIRPFGSLTHLTTLRITENEIFDLAPLQSLTNLTALSLSFNKISDLSPLKSLNNLTRLNLGYNKISDLTPLQTLTNLIWLNLSGNKIQDIKPLSSLTNLTDLALQNNQITDIG